MIFKVKDWHVGEMAELLNACCAKPKTWIWIPSPWGKARGGSAHKPSTGVLAIGGLLGLTDQLVWPNSWGDWVQWETVSKKKRGRKYLRETADINLWPTYTHAHKHTQKQSVVTLLYVQHCRDWSRRSSNSRPGCLTKQKSKDYRI